MPETLFFLGNLLALVGWTLLICIPRWRGIAQAGATLIIPGLLSVAYTVLVMVWWSRSGGGFDSLAGVRELFQIPEILLAGWFHYLAFDLFVGANVARKCQKEGIPHLAVVPLLFITFVFGPVGYVASLALRAAWKLGNRKRPLTEQSGSTGSVLPSLSRWEPRLVAVAFLCYAVAVPTALAAVVDDRALAGANVWLKPLKFELSVGLYLATLALFVPLTSLHFQRSAAGRFVVWGASICGVLEIAYIAWRAARGEASHFNFTTPLAGVLYGLMGVGAILLAAASPVLAWGIGRTETNCTNTVFRLAVILGLVLSFVLGGVEGAIMSVGTGHSVGTPETPDPSLPFVGWSRTVGDLRVPHFIGLHILQIIPVVGAVAATWLGRWARPVVLATAAICVFLNIVLFVQALSGQPFLRVSSVWISYPELKNHQMAFLDRSQL